MLEEVADQVGDVFAVFAQRRHTDREDVQPKEQVGPEPPGIYFRFQVPVRGGDDAHVHRDRRRAADALDGPLLQDAEEHYLRLGRQFADFIEENRPLMGQLEATGAPPRRAGEGAGLVAEQFAGDHARRERGAVDSH